MDAMEIRLFLQATSDSRPSCAGTEHLSLSITVSGCGSMEDASPCSFCAILTLIS